MRVVIDTNVFISGMFWEGESHRVITSWKKSECTLVISGDILSEIVRVLTDFKIRLPKESIQEWSELILKNSVVVEPKETVVIVKDDPQDNMFVEAAIAGKADYIVSQDNHLLKLKEVRGIRIITPEEFNRRCIKDDSRSNSRGGLTAASRKI